MTNEEKQIEEMAEDIKEILVRNFDKTNLYHWVTKDLYTKGYRKASDVAREIFGHIESFFHEDDFGDLTIDFMVFQELKKKYESEGEKGNGNDNK